MHLRDHDGLYILAAVVCDPIRCESTRETLRALRYRKQPRLHWRDEDRVRRDKIAAAVAQFEMAAVVVVGTPLLKSQQERARRICMETLLPHLSGIGVDQVWLEARTTSLNDRDRRHVAALRGRRVIDQSLRVDIERPLVEPMLWISDVVAGAVGADWNGHPRYMDLLREKITELPIKLR